MSEQADPYWTTSIAAVTDTSVHIRGYDLEELIGRIPFTAAAFLLVRGRIPTPQESRTLDAVLSAVLDYGLEKPGTVAARYAVSGNPSMAAGLAAACLSVGSHTLATEDTSRFVSEQHRRYLESGLELHDFATQAVATLRAERRRIPGIGHPVFVGTDPRAARLRAVAEREGYWGEAAKVYEAIHAAFCADPRRAGMPINDVGVMAVVLTELGFTPEEGTGIAILSTMPGLIAHVSEELQSRRPIRVVDRAAVRTEMPDDRVFADDWAAAGWGDRA